MNFLKSKTCSWTACTKPYSEHTIGELQNHKQIAGKSNAWNNSQKFATVASIFSSCLLVFWILLGGLK